MQRYRRIVRLAGVGEEGFHKISQAQVALVGCGTLGGAFALNLARLGVESLRLIDRDIVEEHNLSTQMLFDEEDARQILPKAIAAQRHLQKLNSKCQIEAHATDLTFANAEALLGGVDLILDGSDNFETRYLINDVAVKLGIPWIYSAVVGFTALIMPVMPAETACLRCLLDAPPEASSLPTCEIAGVWPPTAQSAAAVALTEALRILTVRKIPGGLSELDFESGQWRRIGVPRKMDCPACVRQEFPYLQGRIGSQATKMCGRDMVHLSLPPETKIDLASIAEKVQTIGEVQLTDFLLHLKAADAEIYLFPDGRAFVKGVSDPGRARAIFNRYISG